MEKVQFMKAYIDSQLPKRGTEYSAAYDLYAYKNCIVYSYVNYPGTTPTLIDTGIIMGIPAGYCGIIKPRSSLAINRCIQVMAGVIDSDYRTTTVKVALFNHSDENFLIQKGDRIAQILFIPLLLETEEVKEMLILGEDHKGFGSTGLR